MTKEELLTKSIDELVDQLLVEEEKISKADSFLDLKQDAKTTADAVVSQAPTMQDDASRGAGRPKQISDVPKTDEDGKRNGQYDASISSASSEEDQPEADQVKEMNQVKNTATTSSGTPASAPFKKSFEVNEAEYAEFQAFKKSQADKQAEELKKSETEKLGALIKSAVTEATSSLTKSYETEIASLRKSAAESERLLKAIANRPQRAKSVTGIEALEKSMDPSTSSGKESFSKSEVLDAAEELAKSGKISSDYVVELEMTGRVFDKNVRTMIENHLAKKA